MGDSDLQILSNLTYQTSQTRNHLLIEDLRKNDHQNPIATRLRQTKSKEYRKRKKILPPQLQKDERQFLVGDDLLASGKIKIEVHRLRRGRRYPPRRRKEPKIARYRHPVLARKR